jgi:hypothetical protein
MVTRKFDPLGQTVDHPPAAKTGIRIVTDCSTESRASSTAQFTNYAFQCEFRPMAAVIAIADKRRRNWIVG